MKNKLDINYESAVSQFERALKKFQVRKVIYKSVFRGKGLEFDGYRNFNEDDDSSLIDWKASLRANKMLAKQYIEERNLDVYFVVDSGSNMLFGSGKKLKAEYSAEIVSALSNLIMTSGDNAGLVMFGDKITRFLKSGRSKNHFYLFVKYLSEQESYGGKPDFKKVLDFLLNTINKSSVVILISDFINLDASMERELKLLNARFETAALMIRDKFDEQIPRTGKQMVIQSPATGRQMIVDPGFAAEMYARNALEQKNSILKTLKETGIDVLELNTQLSFINPLISFLKERTGGI